MRLQPLTRYTPPAYPTFDEAALQPALLRHVPARWRRQALVLAAVAAAGGLTTAGCRTARAEDTPPPSHVAPLFIHGEGRASFGGAPSMMSTAFLSEEEARQIITEEGQKAGIAFGVEAPTLKAVPVARPKDGEKPAEVEKIDVALDGHDAKKQIAFEFVSSSDLRTWKREQNFGTAMAYDIQGTAKYLRDGIAELKPAGTVGVFYDPAASARKQEDAQTAAREELRKQVKDFITWLKAEKVI